MEAGGFVWMCWMWVKAGGLKRGSGVKRGSEVRGKAGRIHPKAPMRKEGVKLQSNERDEEQGSSPYFFLWLSVTKHATSQLLSWKSLGFYLHGRLHASIVC